VGVPKPKLFSPEQQQFIRDCYLRSFMQPADVASALNLKFKVEFTTRQVNRWINTTGLTFRRNQIAEQAENYVKGSPTNRAIAKDVAKGHDAAMRRFGNRAEKITERAMDMAEQARDARSLSAAVSAAKNGLAMFRACHGLDGPSSGGRAATFNFNFANVPGRKPGESVEVDVTPRDPLDDGEDSCD
jgi:hypothetical protein